ncbi:hypothetical protein [Pontibacter oryzae]|uniref:Uncharacterized protein n=1 Tax=Pontibacter oryzae TaxID=2304593 RepID=A0A399SIP6_9BACT|nr:hypothetical protein [Pontibacter oryzae]RIJ41605.1 hypothetical protein D1627_06130 [Pontibacter oryzae]
MIYMHNFIPRKSWKKLSQIQAWGKLGQEQLSQAILVTKDAVFNYLRRMLQRGHWREVKDILKGKPLTKTGHFVLSELRNQVVSKLMMRLGLRKVIAVALALVLLPLILAQVSGELIRKLKA